MRMHTGAVRTPLESLHLKLTLGEKPCRPGESNPRQLFRLAFRSDANPAAPFGEGLGQMSPLSIKATQSQTRNIKRSDVRLF